MRFDKVYLPAGGHWTSPFSKWQGKFSTLHPLHLAADFTKIALGRREIPAAELDSLVLGWSVPAKQIFYGGPWQSPVNVSQDPESPAELPEHILPAVEGRLIPLRVNAAKFVG